MDWMVGDFNGDGKDDLMKVWNQDGYLSVDVHVSTGSGFVLQRWATQQGGEANAMNYLSGDFNGDGRDDFLKLWINHDADPGERMNVDVHFSGAHTNSLIGGSGADSLYGNMGNDHLDGEAGNDKLHGGAGSNTFYFSNDGDIDYIDDFQDDIDIIVFTGFDGVNADNVMSFATQSGGHVVFDFGDGDQLTVWNTTKAVLENDVLI